MCYGHKFPPTPPGDIRAWVQWHYFALFILFYEPQKNDTENCHDFVRFLFAIKILNTEMFGKCNFFIGGPFYTPPSLRGFA